MYYFDNSATTKPLDEIMKVYQTVSQDYFANPSSAHHLGETSSQLLNQARQQMADLLQFNLDEIYFTSSGTESNNWVLRSILPAIHEKHPNGKKVLISSIEHPSVMQQIPLLESQGYHVELIPVTEEGIIDLNVFESMLDKEVLLVVTIAVNNEVGSIQPIELIAKLLENFPQIIWHVDGVQAVTTQLNLIRNQRIDSLSLSSHKFYSVRGVGLLAKRLRVPSHEMLYGGGQEKGLRASTENLAGIVAMSKALRLANDRQTIAKEKLSSFRHKIIAKLKSNQWEIFAEDTGSEHIICAALASIPGEVLLHAFEAENVFVSTTSACSSRRNKGHATLKAMGIANQISQSAIRLSLSQYTEDSDVNYVCQIIDKITKQFK